MLRSVHDNLLASYEVQCEERTITLRTEFREGKNGPEFTNVIFSGVEAYHFQNDAFGNIIFDVAEVPIYQFLQENGAEISELYKFTARPDWAADLTSASAHCASRGIKGYVLSSSYGLCGWVLAREILITPSDKQN